ncbi:uncharacterized protein MYCFIDRAFT_210512 [Pseudocercospora fijiensis CIRAD86]|uniref:Uncharacterized protein n=1 Tax=Pseudocercospora fijiensis (strain CIRAD86) TaxID=383855 RepID=M3APG4_PSEFD|nr:uncharacterized protein MYCFIDRAFT_210512 [Pseudocercospora fijiensis CIRAD86]EME86506.1 hypothetical protein MYCFIDRAFT_210512 [Pseudocercospora fijiensis CIRAD86]
MLFSALLALGATASATVLFVADYSGNITSLSLTHSNGNYSLEAIHTNDGCAPNPSWLTIDPARGHLYCLNEGLSSPNGSLASFSINSDGSLKQITNQTTPNGPVSAVIYGEPAGRRAIALGHYGGSGVSSYLLGSDGNVTFNQEMFYNLTEPAADPDRQDAPHIHEVITDPTGQYILAPDLGADLVRIYCWDIKTLKLKELDPLTVKAGTGPRHAAFWSPYSLTGSGDLYFYLVGELSATVTAYKVTYRSDNGGLSFTEVQHEQSTWLYNIPQRNAPAEIAVSPDNHFLIVSNRNDTTFTLPNAIGKSDSMTTWQLDEKKGNMVFHQLWPAGGSYPRSFTTNAIGSLVAVGYQMSEAVSILSRDVQSGLIGEPVARIPIAGNVTAVVWYEERALGVLGA